MLHQTGGYTVLATSSQVPPGQLFMSGDQLDQLRRYLAVIHEEFAVLCSIGPGEQFAMEIEFKITSDNILAIKQARPLVFSDASPPPPSPPGGLGGGGGSGGGGPRTSAPGAPRNLTAVGGDGEVVLTWDAPASDGVFAITD